MIEYDKIETLFDRNPGDMKHVIYGKYRLPEFELLRDAPIWHISEKIDGTNIRVGYRRGSYTLTLGGRTDNAQMPTSLLGFLNDTFTVEKFDYAFDFDTTEVTLFGEGYGPKIQSGGWYRDTPGFRLFDVRIGDWWLNWDNVADIANKLGVPTVPVLMQGATIEHALSLVEAVSVTANIEAGSTERLHEGIVARTDPILLMRNGKRLMFKLKVKDLAGEYRALREALV